MFRPGGAGGPTAGPQGLSPALEKMRKTYPDLESGRFIVLADFEAPDQVRLFRTVGADGTEGDRPQPSLSILHGRSETGPSALKVRLERPDDRCLLDGQRAEPTSLLRDWRKYALLLVSIFGPPEGLVLEVTVESGGDEPVVWKRTISISKGWNLCRLDLETVGDTIDLGNVRAVGWRAPQLTAPVDLYFDDVILADNTKQIVGETAGPDELHVFTRGRRIHVAARDRFELGFADGVLTSWQDAGHENLVDVEGLGPWPIPLQADWATRTDAAVTYDDPQLFRGWGSAAAATQRIVEVSTRRVVIEGQWRFENAAAPPSSQPAATGQPSHTWRYVIYPSGCIYVDVTSRAPDSGWGAPRVGYAVGLDARRDFRAIAPRQSTSGANRPQFSLLARTGRNQGDLLWTWPKDRALPREREFVSADDRRLAVIVGDVDADPLVETTHLLRVWPSDIDAAPEAEAYAGDYQNPAVISPTLGQVLKDVPGDANHDGFNEADGCYELALVDGALRFDFDPGPKPRFDPVFRVHGAAQRQCWVYVRGRALQPLGRDAEQNLLFQLGRISGARVSIEVHTTPASAAP